MMPITLKGKDGQAFKVVARDASGPASGRRLVFRANDEARARKFLRSLPEPELGKLGRYLAKGQPPGTTPAVNALITKLCSKHLIVYESGSGGGATEIDSEAIEKLRRDIKLQLRQIIQQELLETARIEAEHQQRSGLGKAAAYAGKFGRGLGESAWSMLTWMKDIYDVVSIQERLRRMSTAAWESYDDDPGQWANKFSQRMIAREHKEVVEALGFDPLKISREMLASAYEIANLIWEDEATRDIIVEFGKDYAAAQHSLEWTQIAGGAAFEIILTAVLAAFTGGLGAAASLGTKVRLLKPLRKLGLLFQDLAKLLKRIKRRKKTRKRHQAGSKIEDYQSDSKVPETSEAPKGPSRALARTAAEDRAHVSKLADEAAEAERRGDTALQKAKIGEARDYLRQQVLDNPDIPPAQKPQALIDRLDVDSPKDKAVFWSGDLDAAKQYAKDIDGVTLESTKGGSIADGWSELGERFPGWEGSPPPNGHQFWSGLSEKYAQGASGTVNVVQSAEKAAVGGGGIWKGTEQPILNDLMKEGVVDDIVFHVVGK